MKPSDGERILAGTGASPGVALGPVQRQTAGIPLVVPRRIPAAAVPEEQARITTATRTARHQINKLRTKARRHGDVAEDISVLFDVYQQMLDGSRLLRGIHDRIACDRINAETAVEREIGDLAEAFSSMEDSYLAARVHDVRQVGERLLRLLTGTPYPSFHDLPRDSVILSHELTPADAALLEPDHVSGFAIESGGVQGHTAIIARALNLPAVVGVSGLVEAAAHAETAILDGDRGWVILDPSPATWERYRQKRQYTLQQQRRLARLRDLPAETRDGATRVTLLANVDLLAELPRLARTGAEGIGLLRSEFLFMNRDTLPGVEEQAAVYTEALQAMDGPVTLRTLDLGGEKLSHALPLSPTADNPALGLRGVRLSLREPSLLETQFTAMLMAAATAPGRLRILLPMISTPAEVRQARQVLEQMARRLRRRHQPVPDPLPPLGVMIEVPAAALGADALALHADFFAIGTNDLTQYTLALDRGDDQVVHLYQPHHPAVLRLIQYTTEVALRAQLPVSVCGEMAADPLFTPFLLGLGLRHLSMASGRIPALKQRIRNLDHLDTVRCVQAVMGESDPDVIRAILEKAA